MIGRLDFFGTARFKMTQHGRRVFKQIEIGALEAQLKRAERNEFFAYGEYLGARNEVRRLKSDIITAKKEAKNGNRKRAVSTRSNSKQRKRAVERQPATDQPASEEHRDRPVDA